jgi:hypothetical protein
MDEVIVQKIRKLHALAESPGNEAEAALAASRVQALLAKHNLDLGEVVLKEDPGATLEVGKAWLRIPGHAVEIARACTSMFDVLFYFHGGRRIGRRFVFVGLKANVEAAAVTHEYLMESVAALARGAKAQGLVYGVDELMAFRLGAATRIHQLAREQKSQTLATNPEYGQLVHIGNEVAHNMYAAIKFRGRGRGGSGGWLSLGSRAYSYGYDQGKRVDLAGARTNRMLK